LQFQRRPQMTAPRRAHPFDPRPLNSPAQQCLRRE
jgi:hypothetical protein